MNPSTQTPLLQVENLCKYYPVFSSGLIRRQTGMVKAVDRVSFCLHRNETLGLVGESGCGKTTTVRAILRAVPPTNGHVWFDNGSERVDLASLPEPSLRPLRRDMQMVFQDPFASLNPRMTVGQIVAEPLVIHRLAGGKELQDRVDEILLKVGLKPEYKTRYPHAFSGGQRQRISIARALIMRPRLVIADEAVSALDVSVQAQIINLLDDLKRDLGLSYIFVAHDLSVVRHICDRVAVLYAGRIVELARTDDLFDHPQHPYTKLLLGSIPNPDPDIKMAVSFGGSVADAARLPTGCAFRSRCRQQSEHCGEEIPDLVEALPGHMVACRRCEGATAVASPMPLVRS